MMWSGTDGFDDPPAEAHEPPEGWTWHSGHEPSWTPSPTVQDIRPYS
jgi:hypothetical protein